MIFGLVNLNGKVNFQDGLFENLSHQISWPDSISETFNHESFYGVFLTDKMLPANSRENIFHRDDKTGISVLLDGVIYNEQEILYLLNLQEPITPPALLAKAYQKWGDTFADKLNGDFAVCIYLEHQNQVIIYTDHLGIRPVAFAVAGPTLYFSSDVMGLSKALFKKEKIDKEYLLNQFLLEGYNFSRFPNRKVNKVNPGHYVKISSGHQEYKQYWYPENIESDKSLTISQVIEELNLLLNDAVTIRSDKRYTASAHISGGLDSGIVAALARKIYSDQPDFYGFSWSPETVTPKDKFNKDERLVVKKFCKQNAINPVFTNFDEEDYMAFLTNWRHPSEFLYERRTVKAARERGINLIFSGWGGDEFISIGDVGIDADLIREFNWSIFLKKYPIRHFRKFSSALLFKGLFPAVRSSYFSFKTSRSIYPYIEQHLKSNLIPRRERLKSNSRRNFQLQIIKKYHLAARTADWFVHGQRNGVEYRYPLLDKRIVEYMLKVPSRCLALRKDRIILRTIGQKFLPDEIINGSKSDPANFYQFDLVVKNIEPQLINEFHIFRSNPDLNFVDFDRLEKNIRKLKNGDPDSDTKDDMLIFHFLKKVHEFTKGYYK